MRNEVIENAVAKAQRCGYLVRPGAVFDFVRQKDGIVEMDPFGAVVWNSGNMAMFVDGFPKGWYTELANIIREDSWWLHRFIMGYDRAFPMMRDISKKGENERWVCDEVAAYGLECRKKWSR